MKITKNIPHHEFKNINESGSIPVAFDAGSKYDEISLNQNLLRGPDYFIKLVNIKLTFSRTVILMDDRKEMYHQILASPNEKDIFCLLWHKLSTGIVLFYHMNVYFWETGIHYHVLQTRLLNKMSETRTKIV